MARYYNRTNTCYRCRKDLLSDANPHREYNKEGNWKGNWLCHTCFHIEYNKEYNKRPDNSIYDRWGFAWKYYHFRGNDGKIIERIYIFHKARKKK